MSNYSRTGTSEYDAARDGTVMRNVPESHGIGPSRRCTGGRHNRRIGGIATHDGSATDRPLLLLDIDGVLIPWAAPVCPDGFREYTLFPGDGEPIRVAAVHGSWIRDMEASFQIVWASAWGADCRILAELLGLPEYPVIAFPPTPFDPRDKLPAIEAYVGELPAAWVDDQHTDEGRRWAESRPAATLLLSTDPAIGLVHRDVELLVDWASNLALSGRPR